MSLQIPVILGPTASNKTSVGIELAKLMNGEIISVDSRKVYRGLPIGTATPRGQWRGDAYMVEGIAHYLMGHLSPDDPYTAWDFAEDAENLIGPILERKRIPILVGGTGFYFKALQKGLPELPSRDPRIREELMKEVEQKGVPALHEQLAAVDPVAARSIKNMDKHKVVRALEVCKLTGQPFSSWKDQPRKASKREFAVMGLRFDRAFLEQRIVTRSQYMVEHGMIEEAQALLNQGFSRSCPALVSFGYKEAVEVIEGTRKRSEFLPSLIKGTKAYAKRQFTWFRTQIQPHWFDCDEKSNIHDIALRMKTFLDLPN